MSPDHEPTACSCYLPEGWYGFCGWHLRKVTADDAARTPELANSVGVPIAVGPCHVYLAAAARRQADRQAASWADHHRAGRLRA